MPIDRRLLRHFEWTAPLLALAVSAIGVMSIYSATFEPSQARFPPFATRQLTAMGLGLCGMLAVLTFDYRRLDRVAVGLYVVTLASVLVVPLLGQVGGGSRRWIRLGPMSLQPSEFMKLALVVYLAHHFGALRDARATLKDAALPILATAVPAAAILAQPDLGSAAVLVFIMVSMLALGGVPLRWLAALAAPVVVVAPFLWGHLKPYQQRRIATFMDPDTDPLGAGYHIIQSKVAVGSGEMWGKGFLQGTQNHLNFLPEHHTDFIFSVFAEEWGFVGGIMLMMLYLALLLRGLVVAQRGRDRFGILLVLGVMTIVFWQIVVNIGMTTGLLPVVGIPLPFVSYGGSSMMSLLVGVGLVMNVSMRRYTMRR